MERGGYPETFDTKTVTTKPVRDEIEREEYMHEFATKKAQAFSNIIEFTIGTILLAFCRFYLQTHPAEKVSLFSGVEVMWQKVQIWFSQMSVEDADMLNQKHNLEKTMQEIVLLSRENSCVDAEVKENIAESFARLQAMDLETYKKQQKAFNTVVSLYYTKVKEACDE